MIANLGSWERKPRESVALVKSFYSAHGNSGSWLPLAHAKRPSPFFSTPAFPHPYSPSSPTKVALALLLSIPYRLEVLQLCPPSFIFQSTFFLSIPRSSISYIPCEVSHSLYGTERPATNDASRKTDHTSSSTPQKDTPSTLQTHLNC